jgi:predicted DNA-binding protein (MmcQ/YjbR family)
MTGNGSKDKGLDEQQIAAFCANWPGVTSSIKWEADRVFSVAGKMFLAIASIGPDRGRFSFKVDTDRFLELTEQPGMMPAPYIARAFWVSVTEPERFARDELEAYVRRSYELVVANLPKKTQATLAKPNA